MLQVTVAEGSVNSNVVEQDHFVEGTPPLIVISTPNVPCWTVQYGPAPVLDLIGLPFEVQLATVFWLFSPPSALQTTAMERPFGGYGIQVTSA